MESNAAKANFVVAVPARTNYYNAYAQALHDLGLLHFYALGTRRGIPGVPPERTSLNPWIGLCSYAAARSLSTFHAESFRFRLLPWFDRWVLHQLEPGNHIISSFGYTNACFRWVRQHGGKTFVEAGNSHPENFWALLSEEHRRWNCPDPPVARHWYERSKAMMADVDYVLSPSSYVTESFLARGFRPEQILKNPFPLDFSHFRPANQPRPRNRPLTIINTGMISLRKGAPYLLEAFRLVHQRHPSARLLLTRAIHDSARPILARYHDLPIDWSPSLEHPQLAERLRSADVFVLPSLEEGLVRTACEALACGLQVVLTPNTGASDFVQAGVNGEVVPIRDPAATAEGVLKCWERIQRGRTPDVTELHQKLSFETFAASFTRQLENLGLG